MPITRRRLLALVAVVVLSVVAGIAIVIVSLAGDTERIDGYWASARLTDDGLAVTEVIDYDFGPNQRRGIFRDVPGVVAGSVSVSSPTAPDDFLVTEGFTDTRIRIGNPAITIDGRHRYRIDYVLDGSTVLQDGLLSWDGIGFDWAVPITDIELWVTLEGELSAPACEEGTPWDARTCTVDDLGSGTYRVGIDALATGEGATISGFTAARGGVPGAGPEAPSGPADDPGAGLLMPLLVTFGAVLMAGLAATFAVRRAGWERVWSGGAADAAFGEAADGLTSRRLDEKQLAALATIEFEPPRDTSAVEGGLLLQERVRDEHRAAWLLESAIRGEIEIDDGDDPTLRWGPNAAHPSVHQILDAMFDGRREITLGEYDEEFTSGWNRLGRRAQGLAPRCAALGRDRPPPTGPGAARRRRSRPARGSCRRDLRGGAARNGGAAVVGIGVGALLFGLGVGALASSYELLIRTEAGSAMWLRIESFRRFLENSEARHVDDAAERGVLAALHRLGGRPRRIRRRGPTRSKPPRASEPGAPFGPGDRPRVRAPRLVDRVGVERRLDRAVVEQRRGVLRRGRWRRRRRRRRLLVTDIAADDYGRYPAIMETGG